MTYPHSERVVAGRYRLLRELGRGGMGVVWEGYDILLNRSVAVKEVLLPPNLSPAEHQVQLTRTSREARTAARLNHSGIVAIYDVAEQDGRPWIVMELVRARGLDEVGLLPVRRVADIGRQVLSALRAAHEAGILHRDVKPSNILLDAEGRAVLSDFGIAVIEGDTSLTQTGMVTGSPSFLPPERATGVDAGPWSDLWALGATLYAALVGHGPFERRDAISTLGALLTEEPDFGVLPQEMRAVLTGMLQREPAHRLTAQQADAMLAEVINDPSAAARRTGETAVRQGRGTGGHRTGGAPSRTEENFSRIGKTSHRTGERERHDTRSSAVPGRRGRGRLPLIVGAVVLLAAGGAAAAVAMSQPEQRPVARSAPTAAETAPEPAEETESATPTPTPTPTPKPTRTRTAAPAGGLKTWRARPPENWSISYPAGWNGDWAAETGYTQWLRRDGAAHMSVEPLEGSTEGLDSLLETVKENVAQWSEIDFEDTAKIPLAYGAGLQWEFTWTMKDSGGAPWAEAGVTYHEVRRFVEVGDSVMVLSWTTHDADWVAQKALMTRVFDSFHPRGGE
ncbi:serine/threonine-protein kinase [Streptosporangium sp. NPDC023963]|uniref:serine/threonine-protein kinase n=1 Tax=Streptosporangium sp. NPDC023963 TaxID=3155608 RepID=UPI00342AEAFA